MADDYQERVTRGQAYNLAFKECLKNKTQSDKRDLMSKFVKYYELIKGFVGDTQNRQVQISKGQAVNLAAEALLSEGTEKMTTDNLLSLAHGIYDLSNLLQASNIDEIKKVLDE